MSMRGRALRRGLAPRQEWYVEHVRCHADLPPGNAMDNVVLAVRLAGRLDQEALGAALDDLVVRHQMLRSSFPDLGDAACQLIYDDTAMARTTLDFSTDDDPYQSLLNLVEQRRYTRIDISTFPVVGADVVVLGPEDHALVLRLHHLLIDALSTQVLFADLEALYRFRIGAAPPPEPLGMEYSTFVERQRARLMNGASEADVDYWEKVLEGVQHPLPMPVDRPRNAVDGYVQGAHKFQLPASVVRSVEAFASRQHATPYMVYLAAYHALLHQLSGVRRIVLATTQSARDEDDEQQLLGHSFNLVWVATDLTPNTTFEELLNQVRGHVLDAYEHRDVPTRALVKRLRPDHAWSSPFDLKQLSHAYFDLVSRGGALPQLEGLQSTLVPIPTVLREFRLPDHPLTRWVWQATDNPAINLSDTGGLVGGHVTYNQLTYEPDTIQRLASAYTQLLHVWAARPETPLGTFATPAGARDSRTGGPA